RTFAGKNALGNRVGPLLRHPLLLGYSEQAPHDPTGQTEKNARALGAGPFGPLSAPPRRRYVGLQRPPSVPYQAWSHGEQRPRHPLDRRGQGRPAGRRRAPPGALLPATDPAP